MPKSTLEYITAIGRISCLEIKCPRCKTHSVFHKTAFPWLDSLALRVIRSADPGTSGKTPGAVILSIQY